MRYKNCVRRLWFSGPLSRSTINRRTARTASKRSRFRRHHASRASTMKSLVTLECVKYRSNSSYSGTKIPKGVNWPFGWKSSSAPALPVRLEPPRENGPIFTVALASRDTRSVSRAARASSCTCLSSVKMASVSYDFFGGGTCGLAQAKAQGVELGGDGLQAGQLLIGVALTGDESAADLRGGQAAIQARGAKGGVGLDGVGNESPGCRRAGAASGTRWAYVPGRRWHPGR